MPTAILYMSPGACSRVTMTALEEAGVPYEDRCIDLHSGAQQKPEYLAINRKGKVPALVWDGELLTENAAILELLDLQFPAAKLLPHSTTPFARARLVSDLVWCASTLHPMVRQNRNPQRFTQGDPAGVRADGQQKFSVECDHIASRLADCDWWHGAEWSIVDTYLYWAYSTAAKGGFPLTTYPSLLAHGERVRARPAFQSVLAKERAAVERVKMPIDPATL